MDLYIARIDNNQVFALEEYAGITYQQGMAIIATLPLIKAMCDTVGWSYDNYEELLSA